MGMPTYGVVGTGVPTDDVVYGRSAARSTPLGDTCMISLRGSVVWTLRVPAAEATRTVCGTARRRCATDRAAPRRRASGLHLFSRIQITGWVPELPLQAL
jgi:hypothetical protein